MSPSVLLLLVICLSAVQAEPSAPTRTYSVLDRNTNTLVECDFCPPGTFMVSSCTTTQATRCSPCPAGSFVDFWNIQMSCLPCETCDWTQYQTAECRANSNRQCQCQPGHYQLENMDTCLPHSTCPPGEGVLHQGTLVADTVCQPCPNGTFSNHNSAQQECLTHQLCESLVGFKSLLPGTTWHNSICVKCDSIIVAEAEEYFAEILPAFFAYHALSRDELANILYKISGKTLKATFHLSSSELEEEINTWLFTATTTQLEQLPLIVQNSGARTAGEKLQTLLKQIRQNLTSVCG
ncbi:tumor necrosis factor receptor superfamily member 6B-like [Synchiropus splendidus]|uniref:tumor necrosis factor receptor superfamily member 6B-like n=1 Tax=Synchiropus splendidus TaxID=270530 RepID=UPI00237DDAD9|nr:tumor necrosis factor receptor superfamily member 6B-like [Synchiropus splendidus]